jgi:hypothetical protein
MTKKLPVYEEGRRNVVARVKYNNNLDFWNGQNWSSGSTGRHLGLTRLKDGRFVLIYGSDWQGERDYGILVSKKRAIQEIIRAGADEQLDRYDLRESVTEADVKRGRRRRREADV